MKRTITLPHIIQLCALAAAVLGLCAPPCRASVEPDLSAAIRERNAAKVKELLLAGADVNERDDAEEQTPLMRAVQVKDAGFVRALLAHGAAVNVADDSGKTALMFAASTGDGAIVALLLHSGADASLRDSHALSAPDIARTHGHTAVARLLGRSKSSPRPFLPAPSRPGEFAVR